MGFGFRSLTALAARDLSSSLKSSCPCDSRSRLQLWHSTIQFIAVLPLVFFFPSSTVKFPPRGRTNLQFFVYVRTVTSVGFRFFDSSFLQSVVFFSRSSSSSRIRESKKERMQERGRIGWMEMRIYPASRLGLGVLSCKCSCMGAGEGEKLPLSWAANLFPFPLFAFLIASTSPSFFFPSASLS